MRLEPTPHVLFFPPCPVCGGGRGEGEVKGDTARAEALTDPARPAASVLSLGATRLRGGDARQGGPGAGRRLSAARGSQGGSGEGRQRRAASPGACGGSMISSAASRGPAKSCYASLRCVAFSCHFFS